MKVISYKDRRKAVKVVEEMAAGAGAKGKNTEEGKDLDGKSTVKKVGKNGKVIEESPVVLWVTPPGESKTKFGSYYATYGNEAQLDGYYADLNVVFCVPPAGERMK